MTSMPFAPKRYPMPTDGGGGNISGLPSKDWARITAQNEPIEKAEPKTGSVPHKMARRGLAFLLQDIKDFKKREPVLEMAKNSIADMHPEDLAAIAIEASFYDFESCVAGLRLLLDSPAKSELAEAVKKALDNGARTVGETDLENMKLADFGEDAIKVVAEAVAFANHGGLDDAILGKMPRKGDVYAEWEDVIKCCVANFRSAKAIEIGIEKEYYAVAVEAISSRTDDGQNERLFRKVKGIIEKKVNDAGEILGSIGLKTDEVGAYSKLPENMQDSQIWHRMAVAIGEGIEKGDADYDIRNCLACIPPEHRAAVAAQLIGAQGIDAETTAEFLKGMPEGEQGAKIWKAEYVEKLLKTNSYESRSKGVELLAHVPPGLRAPFAKVALEASNVAINEAVEYLASVPEGPETEELWRTAILEYKAELDLGKKGEYRFFTFSDEFEKANAARLLPFVNAWIGCEQTRSKDINQHISKKLDAPYAGVALEAALAKFKEDIKNTTPNIAFESRKATELLPENIAEPFKKIYREKTEEKAQEKLRQDTVRAAQANAARKRKRWEWVEKARRWLE